MAISKAVVKSSLTPKHLKRQTMYKSCSLGSIQPTALTKDSLDYWSSDSVVLFLLVFNSRSASSPPPSPFNCRLYLLVCLGFLLETTRPQNLRVCKLLKVYFSERSHFLVSFFFLIIIPHTFHAAFLLFQNMTLSSVTLSIPGVWSWQNLLWKGNME